MSDDKLRWYKFWIKSNRGTDQHTFVRLPHRLDFEEVKDEHDEWCRINFPACHEYSYGWEKVRRPTKVWVRGRIRGLKADIVFKKQELAELEAML